MFNLKDRLKISKNVFALGWVSFFNDIASEMLYPVVPIFLTTVLGAPVSIVGLIEGIAESTASFLKMASGWVSDKAKSRKPFVAAGYSLSAVSKLILGFAFSWHLVLTARFVDRFGKGVRTAARDALIVESSSTKDRGKSFGFHRALDSLGAVIGPLLAIVLIKFFGDNLRLIFFLAFIPAVLGVFLLVRYVKDVSSHCERSEKIKFNWRELHPSLKIFLLVTFVFSLGNSSDAFLILRAKSLGLATIAVIFAYVLFNISYSVFSTPAGMLSDKIGPRKVLFAGFILFAVVYFFFGIAGSGSYVWFLFPLYGIYMAITDGVGKAYISKLVPHGTTGTAFGFYQLIIGLCTFFSSLIAGLLWTHIDPRAPFIFGSILSIFSAILFYLFEKMSRREVYSVS